MEKDLAPKPLRIVKRASAPAPARRRQPSGMSGCRYPPIPRRQSSLRVNYRQFSSESGTSTETPPLREGFERLNIPKKRRSEVDDLEKGLQSEAHTNNPIDCNEPDAQSRDASSDCGTNGINGGFSRIFNTLGFGSWGNLMRHLSMDSAGSGEKRVSNGDRVPFGHKVANETLDKLDLDFPSSLSMRSRVPSIYNQPDEASHPVDGPTGTGYSQIIHDLIGRIDEAIRTYFHGDTEMAHDCSTEV